MYYNDFQGEQISALGLGCMRLPMQGEHVDIEATREMTAYAIEHGINYFDTAWGYLGGESETVMGEVLHAYPRHRFYLASKFPGYDLSNMGKVEEIFEKQLEKCQVDYFDFYLFHNVCELNIEQYLDPQYGIYDYLIAQKKNGRIRHLGFSAHGNLKTMRRFLEAYGRDMEFCQLQVNYLDWRFQNAKEKIDLVSAYGIPVFVMEGIRGGALANLDAEYEEKLRALRPHASNAEWALRFVQDIPQVVMTLSGMSNMEQLRENVAVYQGRAPLGDTERETLFEIARAMTAKKALPCTSCRYCTSHCPQELNIPWLIELYNEHLYSGGGFIAPMALSALEKDKLPSACLSCKACEAVCPQNIEISRMMRDFTYKLES